MSSERKPKTADHDSKDDNDDSSDDAEKKKPNEERPIDRLLGVFR